MMVRENCRLEIRQQPLRAQVVQENNPKNRKPIDPPPIVELKYEDRDDPSNKNWLVSPRTFMMVTLINADDATDDTLPSKTLIGSTVSSLHRLKDVTNVDGGFFVFGDISARQMGTYRLRFSLFDSSKETEEVAFMGSIDSNNFRVLAQRDFGAMQESSTLTRTFSDQGVKLRVRKDNRAISSVVGTKRAHSFNASPPDTSSPSNLAVYGGPVQDHHYSHSAHSPAAKRQRSGSEYDASNLYHMPLGDNPLAQYSNSIPSGSRAWSSNDIQRMQNSYGQQQQQSPMSMSMMGAGVTAGTRMHPMGVQSASGWQGMHQHSALPSPASSASNQHQSTYPSVSSQQQSSAIFGDPGAASSIPRNYYGGSYHYPNQGDAASHPYPDLQLSSSVPDSGYLESSGIYTTESGEVAAVYGSY